MTSATDMTTTVDPRAVAAAVVDAVACRSRTAAIFAESSSSMFYGTHALCELVEGARPHYEMSVHYGSMGHALGGALGFCAATGQRAVVLTGDGSLQLMNPLPAAVKHGYAMTIVVLNDSRLALPFFGSERVRAFNARETTQLASWDFTRQGSPSIGGRRVSDPAGLDDAVLEALGFDGCFVLDAQIDPTVVAPVGERLDAVARLFGGKG